VRRLVIPLLVAIASNAVALEADRAISQYSRRAWKLEDGLPNSVVRGILQTADGYLWIATYEGLARFNGDTFTRFDKKNLSALRRDTVLAFMKSRDGALWIGTNGGGAGFLQNGKVRVLTASDGLPSDIVAALAESRDGTVWIGTSAGVCAWRKGRVENVVATTASVLSLAESADGTMWIGTRGGGLLRASGTSAPLLANASVYSLLADRDETLWAGTSQGLMHIANGEVRAIEGIPHDQVTALLRDSDGTLWVGTYSQGLFRLAADGATVARFTTAEGLLNNSVRSLFEDSEKNIWVGSNGGVECLTRGKFIPVGTPEGLADPYARSVFEDRDGNVWIGTAHGLTRFARGGAATTFTTQDGLSNDYIFGIAQAPDGAMWIGTPTGLNRLVNGRATTFTEADGLSSRSVRALYFDRAGVLWIGTDRGLTRYAGGRFEILSPGPKWETTFVQTFAEGADGSIWIGADGRGMARFHDGKFTVWTDRDGLPDMHILTLLVDREQTLWIGTDSAGLIRFRDGRFTRYTVDSGLWSDKVLQLLEDTDGRLWFGGGRGIWSVDARELNEVASHKRARVTSRVFDAGDGARSVECNGSIYPSAMRSRDGRLWFATVDGVATISPRDAAARSLRPPPVLIESVSIDGRVLGPGQRIVVPRGVQHVEIRYAALTYVSPEKAEFRYRLEGFDRDWVSAGPRRTAFFTGVPPGEYRFHVIAANADGVWNRDGAVLAMKIEPRFTQTIWFPLLVLALLVSGVWLLQQRRVYVMKRREAELVRVVEERTSEIKAALDAAKDQEKLLANALVEAEAANQAKSIFLASVSHELRTPLNAIIGFAGVLQRDGEKTFTDRQLRFVHNVAVSGEHLLALINDILDLAKIESGKMMLELNVVPLRETLESVIRVLKGITIPRGIEIEVDLHAPDASIVADTIKLKQIIFNLISNAVKFSPDDSTIRIVTRRLDGAVAISVIDRGIGIAPDHHEIIFEEFRQIHAPNTRRPPGTGLGLSLVRKFAELHGGIVTVESTLGEGSTFTVVLPVLDLLLNESRPSIHHRVDVHSRAD